jgi:ribonuclease HI
MQQSNRSRDSIIQTIENWGNGAFTNPILNRIWQLLPGLYCLEIMEREKQTHFPFQTCPPSLHLVSDLWKCIGNHKSPTMVTGRPHWKSQESLILSNWNLNLPSISPNTPLHSSSLSPSLTSWHFPPTGFVKLNFDGASKGNPGPSGFGVVLRNNNGQIMYILAGHLGHDTNNSAEIWGLIRGIQLATSLNLNHLIFEGDSQVVIELATKLINGSDPAKVSPSWHLLIPLETLFSLLRPSLTLIPSHVRREANKVVDKLANEGVSTQAEDILIEAHQSPTPPLLTHCKEIALRDSPPQMG